ncbi:MAG: patatin-like phospholipase family protein [Kiloniellaceae bacterium]
MSDPAHSERPVFELGLVMAGAISAGAYTAGVMDFLIEALDAYYAARAADGWDGPRHDVRVPVLAGASAGGMTSAISAVQFMHPITHMRPGRDLSLSEARRNQLYHSWVQQIDIAKLLGTEDLKRRKALVSALDSSALPGIAGGALEVDGPRSRRPWVGDPLAVFLTVANLRGMPYGFRLYGATAGDAYGMTNHMDDMRFAVTWDAPAPHGFVALPAADCPGGDWPKLADAALATGAFPVGLSPRILTRSIGDYFDRGEMRDPVAPRDPDSYKFVCVDGGLMNNEPLEQARRYLARGEADNRNPRDGAAARRSVIMIDPFPNVVSFAPYKDGEDRILAMVPKMFGALVSQARFKLEEMKLAESEDNFSRFVISPSRRNAAGRLVEPAIASATLGGFGGFFHESFRRHDYLLGRRNCRSFLLRYLVLPESNPLFAGMGQAQRDAWYAREFDGSLRKVPESKDAPAASRALPIIPLVAALQADEAIPPADFPKPQEVDFARIESQVKDRIKAVSDVLVDEELGDYLPGWVRFGAKAAVRFSLQEKLTRTVMKKLREGLVPLDSFAG